MQETQLKISTSLPYKIFKFLCVLAFFTLQILLTFELIYNAPTNLNSFFQIFGAITTILLSYLASDFISGVVHFLCDNFGSEKTPLIGKHFIIPFRLHHIDPEDITRHGFIDTNAHNCLMVVPMIAIAAFAIPHNNYWTYLITLFIWGFSWGIFGTNQFHKWAHMPTPPKAAKIFMKLKLILSTAHHAIHHNSPFDKYYCITTGWLNRPLEKLKIFEFIVKKFKKTSTIQQTQPSKKTLPQPN